MQHVMIVTALEPWMAAGPHSLRATLHNQHTVLLQAENHQQVNVTTVAGQSLPFVLFSDQLLHSTVGSVIPPDALVSVMPMSAASVEQLLAAGKADQLMAMLNRGDPV